MISGKELAKLLKVAAPSLSEAAKKGHYCAGHNVKEWVIKSPSGRAIGYKPPESITKVVNESSNTSLTVLNSPNKALSKPNKVISAKNESNWSIGEFATFCGGVGLIIWVSKQLPTYDFSQRGSYPERTS
jgi:hypothetical protein